MTLKLIFFKAEIEVFKRKYVNLMTTFIDNSKKSASMISNHTVRPYAGFFDPDKYVNNV